MNCLRCHGLMVTIRLEDAGGSSLAFSGCQCLICGEVIDSVINANRKELHGQTGSRCRARYGVSLGQKDGSYPGGDSFWGQKKGFGS
jgi:hypothetical protein